MGGRAPLVAYVEGRCFQQGATLRQIVAAESGKFREVYSAVFKLVQQEPAYAAFAAKAKALAARTKRETPDFHQSSNALVVVMNHAVAARPGFAAFFQGVAGQVGAGCAFKPGPPKDLFRVAREDSAWRS